MAQLNEIKRMQQLAGIKESDQKNAEVISKLKNIKQELLNLKNAL